MIVKDGKRWTVLYGPTTIRGLRSREHARAMLRRMLECEWEARNA